MSTLHVTEAEAARDLPGLLAQVRAGNEVVIESEATPTVVMRPAAEQKERTIQESILSMRAYEEKLGYAPVMDEDFARDLQAIIENRRPSRSLWEDE